MSHRHTHAETRWESWSLAAIAIFVAVVAITALVIALVAGMIGDG